MKNFKAIAVVGLTLGLMVFSAAAALAGPKMVVPQPTVKMGDVLKGPAVKAEFIIQNQGDMPLIIKKVTPG